MKGTFIQTLLAVLTLFAFSLSVKSQTFVLQPAKSINAEGAFNTALLLKKDKQFRLDWKQLTGANLNLSGTGSKLIIGRAANSYDFLEIDVSGQRADLIPNNINLPAGRYYARITNSTNRTTSSIQSDQQANPASVIYSNEILLLVEANDAPAIISPRGRVSNPTPIFQWSSVSGVPSYWLILSSTPFDIVEDADGNISIEGASIVWQYITKNTTAEYGAINRDSPFIDEAPPLNPGQEYSFTILNVYEENNPGFTSPVFGGIIPFIFTDPNAVPKTELISPAANEVFISEPTITFNWGKVANANNYSVKLFQLMKQQGIDVTVPIWTSTTTNTSVEYPALESLKNGKYQWNVITNNSLGGGTTSSSRFFDYKVETGEFSGRIQSSSDNSILLGVELSARAISGGVSPSIPYFVQSEYHSDSLVAGVYEFSATKIGYESNKTQVTIRDGVTSNFTLKLKPLPSSITGIVKDTEGNNVENVTVNVVNISTNEIKKTTTDVNGKFSIFGEKGTYTIDVTKTGYLSPSSRSVTINVNEQRDLTTPFVITSDQATVSGVVFNEDGLPVQRATVKITNGTKNYDTQTNGSGNFQFIVASGNWNLSVEKIGFVKPSNKSISLSTGDVLQNQDFRLTGNANQVVGYVRERIVNEDGSTGSTPFKDIVVRAVPNVGESITASTALNGQYTLSLKSGSYTLQVTKNNYTSNVDRELVIGIAIGETVSGMDFELIPNPSSISGTVTLPDGNGVAGATVSIPNVGTTTTSSSGFYKLSVSAGSHSVGVKKSGLVSPTSKSVTINAGQNLTGLDFEMTPNAGSISGNVKSGGESLANTTLYAINSATNRRVELINGLDGNYSFNIQSGSWYIKAVKSGFLSDSTATFTVGPGQQLVNKNFSLVKNLTTLRGTVTDGINPIKNVTLTVTRLNGSSFNQSTLTQLNGNYAFSLPAGVGYQITASKDGYKTVLSSTNTLIPEQTVTTNFTLSANPSSVAGKVTISGQSVLQGGKVVAINSSGVRIDSTTTKTDGTYLLGLNPDTYTLVVSKAGYTSRSKSVTLSIGQNSTGINYSVDENFVFFNGEIKDSDANTLEQVFINVLRAGGGGGSTVTDQNGAFSLSGLIGGSYTIQLSKSGYVAKSFTRNVSDGDFISLNEVMIAKNGSISGTVKDNSSASISDATVIASNSNGNTYTAITDVNGGYSFNALELGNYSINASKIGFTSGSDVTASITETTLNVSGTDINGLVPNNVTISGIVTNSASSASMKDVEVSITGTGGSGFGITDASGNYSVSNLSTGTYTIVKSKDGFKSDTSQVTVDAGSTTATSSAGLIPNNGKIVGVVKDPNGAILPFRVTVSANAADNILTTQTNLNGEFVFDGIETGLTYRVATDIYKDGYENVLTEVLVPFGATETPLSDELNVLVKKSSISGNIGIVDASVQLLNASDDQVLDIVTSDLSGNYEFTFLAAGEYKILPVKSGYTFNPGVSNVISLGIETASTASFTAVSNIATLDVQVNDVSGAGVSNVDVTIISADTTVILTKKTNSSGLAQFSDIKASTYYVVRPIKEGFSADPTSQEITLNSGDVQSTSFVLSANNGSLSGNTKLKNGETVTNLGSVGLLLVDETTGKTTETVSNNSGAYSFANLAGGNYSVIATRTGFTADTVSVTISAGSNTVASDLTLIRSSIDVRGVVQLKGVGVEGVSVTALSTTSISTSTDGSGNFRFAALPIKTGVNDTTVYKINITKDIFSISYLLSITADQVGTRINLPVTFLPSGKIELTVTDGVEPIAGAELQFGISGGESSSIITGNDGFFESSDNLRKASYTVSVAKEGFLFPQNTIRIALPSDTTVLSREVFLPYTQLDVKEILADQETEVRVVNPSGYNNAGTSGILYYKQASQSQFSQVTMVKVGDTLQAAMPAFGSVEEVEFYTSITDTIRNNTYVSSQSSIVPLASGILSNIRVTPTLSGQKLRAGDTYKLDILVRDGINKSLEEKFVGDAPTGEVSWQILGGSTGLELLDQQDTGISLKAVESGSYQLQVSVTLDGIAIRNALEIEVTDVPLKEILVSAPAKQISNTTSTLFSYSAVDTTGSSVILGETLEWSVFPTSSGTIDNRGIFESAGSSIIGTFSVQVKDDLSGLVGESDLVELIARIEPDKAYSLTNGTGLELLVDEGSVDIVSQLSLGETTPPKTKKFVFAQGSEQSYTVGDKIYILSFSGSELKKPAELVLPEDSSLALNSGIKEIGQFNFTTLQWELLETSAKAKRANDAVIIERLGQFSVLAENEPLGIKYAAVLPSPFSPDVAPVKIGYWLDTAFPPAKVNVHIYNIRGELVRTILEDDLQQPGRYGSTSSNKELIWDGLTDSGTMARNGRYVIQIKAKDQQDEVVKLLQVILIK